MKNWLNEPHMSRGLALNTQAGAIVKELDETTNKSVGCFVLVFDFGPARGPVGYASNASRREMGLLLREFLRQFEAN